MADIQSNIKVNIDTNGALASLKVLQGQISAFHQEMGRSGALAASEMSRLQNNFMNAVNRSGQFDARMKTIKTTTESFTEALEKNKMSMGQYFRYAGAATKDFGKLFKGEFDTIEKVARERVKDLQTQYIKMGRDANGAMKAIAVRPLMLDLDDLGTKTQIAAQKQQLLNQLLKQGSTNMLNWGKNTQWAGRQLMVGFTIPLTMLGQIAAKTFMDMEQSVIKFQRVYGDFSTTTQQTKDMTAEVTNLAKAFTRYGLAVSDTVGMAADAAAMGKQGKDLLAQVESASRLSVLGGIDQKQALETTISLTNAFGIASDQLASKINFLNVVENQTVTSIEDLTIAIPKAAPVIQQLGGDVEDLTFFLTAMKEGGINASEGANALKSGLASIINPTKKASDMLNGFGVNIKGIVDANKGDVKGMVMGVAEALNTLDPLNRAQAIEQLFGKFQFARISTLFKNITDVNSQASSVARLAAQGPEASAILAQRELKKIEESPMFKFKKALEDLKVELVPLGQQFLQAVTPIAKFFSEVLKNFNGLSSGTKDTIGLITGLVAGIGPVALMVIGLIANGIANMIKLFASVKSFFNSLGKGTQDLGSQTAYMTQEQIDAQAVAASLEQTHSKLTQTFTSEAGAIAKLRAEMEKAVAVQNQFNWSGNPTNAAKPKKGGKNMASGGVVQGPGGPTDDAVPTNLSNGEVVLSVDTVKKNPGIIGALLKGQKINIPGFKKSGTAGDRSYSDFRVYTDATSGISSGANSSLNTGTARPADIASEFKTSPTRIQGPLIDAIIADLTGAKTQTEVDAAISRNPGVVKYARELSLAIADEVGSITAETMGDPQYYDSVEKARAKVKTSPEIQASADKFFATPTTFEDDSQERRRSSGRYMALGRERLSDTGTGRYTTRFSRGMRVAGNLDVDEPQLQNPVAAHMTAPRQVSASELEGSGVVLGRAASAAKARKEAGVKSVYAQGDTSTRVDVPADATKQAKDAALLAGKSVVKEVAKAAEVGVAQGAVEQGQIASPSKVTKEIGANYGKGFIVGAKEAMQSPVVSPAAMQHARDQVHKLLKPYTDPQGVINTQKLNDAYRVQVRVITENEKALRQGIQMMRVARMPQDMFWKAVDKTGQVARAVGSEIKNTAIYAFESLKAGIVDLGNKAKAAAIQVKESATGIGQKIKSKWQDQVDPNTGQVVKEGWKSQLKNNFRGGGGVMAVGAVAGMATQLPGKAGEIAGQVAAPITAAASAMMMLPGPIGLVVGGLIGIATVIGMVNAANEKANKQALALGSSMAATSKKVKAFGEATGKISATELRQAQQDARVSGVKTSSAQDEFAKQFVEGSDAGKQLMADVVTQKESKMTSDQIGSNLANQLGFQIAQGTITQDQAKAIAKNVGDQLKDQRITAVVEGQLNEIFGPDGQNLATDPLSVTVELTSRQSKTGQMLFDESLYTDTAEAQASIDETRQIASQYGGPEAAQANAIAAFFGSIFGTDEKMAEGMVGKLDPNKKDQAKTSAQLGVAGYGSGQQALDILEQSYATKILDKQAELDSATTAAKRLEIEQQLNDLQDERTKAIASQVTANKENYDYLVNQKKILSESGVNYNEDIFKTAITSKYENDPIFKNIAPGLADQINSIDTTTTEGAAFQTRLQIQFAGGELNPTQVQTLLGLGEDQPEFQANYDLLVNKVGDAKTTELLDTIVASGGNATTARTMIDIAAKDPESVDTTLSTLKYISDLNGTTESIDIDINTEAGQASLATFNAAYKTTTDALQKTPKAKLVVTAVTDPKVQKLIEQSKVFKGLSKNQRIKYLATYNATMALKGDPALNQAWQQWAKGRKGDVTFPAFARFMAGEAGAAAPVSSTPETTGDTNNSGGSAPTKSDKANAALSILGRKEEKINKAYDERVKALDAIQKANDRINQQKKDQLDLADALSKGDIGAAARAQQQARQNAQTTALQQQQEQMSAARDAQIASLRVNGMSRAGLEAFLNKESDKSDKKTLGGWRFATGGMVPKTQYFALGGQPKGTDTIAAMLTPGEFVVKKSAVDSLGAGTMNKINSGKLPSKGNSMYNYSVMINVKSDADADQIAKTVISQIQKIDNQAIKGNNA